MEAKGSLIKGCDTFSVIDNKNRTQGTKKSKYSSF
jgi:hypothetical protein